MDDSDSDSEEEEGVMHGTKRASTRRIDDDDGEEYGERYDEEDGESYDEDGERYDEDGDEGDGPRNQNSNPFMPQLGRHLQSDDEEEEQQPTGTSDALDDALDDDSAAAADAAEHAYAEFVQWLYNEATGEERCQDLGKFKDEELYVILRGIELRWLLRPNAEQSDVLDKLELLNSCCDNFRVQPTEEETNCGMVRIALAHVIQPIIHLWRLCTQRGLIAQDTESGKELTTRFNMVFAVVQQLSVIMAAMTRVFVCSDRDRFRSAQLGDLDMSMLNIADAEEEEKAKLRVVYEHVLHCMYENNLRKSGDDVYEQISFNRPRRVKIRPWPTADSAEYAHESEYEEFATLHLAARAHGITADDLRAQLEGALSMRETLGNGEQVLNDAEIEDRLAQAYRFDVQWAETQYMAGRQEMYAWRKTCTISHFVYDTVRKEFDYKMYCYMRFAPHFAKTVITWLQESSEFDFDEVSWNRELYSFKGDLVTGEGSGLYSTLHAFFPFAEKARWPEIAREATEWWAELRSDTQGNPTHTPIVLAPPQYTDCAIKFFDETFDERWASMDLVADHREVTLREGIDRPRSPQIDDEDEEDLNGPIDSESKWNLVWARIEREIPAPDIDMLLSTQKLDVRSRMILLGLMGRALFEGKRFDSYQVMLFIKGIGGSGKSTLLNLHANLFPDGKVGILGNEVEQNFPLFTLKDAWVVHWPEAGGKTTKMISETLLKSMIAMERVSVNQKYLGQVYKEWRAQILAACNELPRFDNRQRSMTRRLIVVPYAVIPAQTDTSLPDRLEKQHGAFLSRIALAYHIMTTWIGTRELRALDRNGKPIMGEKNWVMSQACQKELDSVFNFLSQENVWEFGADCVYPEQDFIADYNNFCRERMITISTWSADLYQAAFDEKGLSMKPNVEWTDPHEPGAQPKRCMCVVGITKI